MAISTFNDKVHFLAVLIWFSSLAFLYFGINCFVSNFIKTEFLRYGLPKYRQLTGYLQIAGALGLLYGYYYKPSWLLAASVGLSILMLAGFVVRIRIKDSFFQSLPACFFALLQASIAVFTYLIHYKPL
ncbi:DoxX family protein [Bizionia sediminis]|uniref:DoxX family protein n=1 Tax=Bizionia sediminis TaxID=1737064 RepID=A0ABW5KR71_9FLAO